MARRRSHKVHVDNFEPQAGDPLHQPDEGRRIREFGAEGGRALANGDLAVVEFRAKHRTGLASERDLIRLEWHRRYAPSV